MRTVVSGPRPQSSRSSSSGVTGSARIVALRSVTWLALIDGVYQSTEARQLLGLSGEDLGAQIDWPPAQTD